MMASVVYITPSHLYRHLDYNLLFDLMNAAPNVYSTFTRILEHAMRAAFNNIMMKHHLE